MNFKPILRLLCHQKPERSYSIGGEQLIVCSRCLGIYTGFLFSFISLFFIFGFFKMGLNFIYAVFLLVPMAIDGLTQAFGLRESTNWLRFLTGYLAGFAVACVLYALLSISFAPQAEREVLVRAFPLSGNLPNIMSFYSLAILLLILIILEKSSNRKNLFLKKFFNFTAVFSAAFLIAAIIVLYVLILLKFMAGRQLFAH